MSKSYVPSKDLESFKSRVTKVIQKTVGFNEQALITVVMNCITSGYDVKRMTEKLGTLLDWEKGAKLADRIQELIYATPDGASLNKTSKRSIENGDVDSPKKIKDECSRSPPSRKTSNPEAMSEKQIEEMMARAQQSLQQRKRELFAVKMENSGKTQHSDSSKAQNSSMNEYEKQRKIQQLQAQIKSKLDSGILKMVNLANKSSLPGADKPAPLILDNEGRTVDVTGKEIQLTQVAPTLKANIRARKREAFGRQTVDEDTPVPESTRFFDPRIGTKVSTRGKRTALKFNEPGKYQQAAERLRMKSQLERLQNEIAQIARKTGISSATKLAQLTPQDERDDEYVPEVEWWDAVIMEEDNYNNIQNENCTNVIKASAITHLVEHPTQMKPPTDPDKPVFMPIFLTRAERKKLRRQNRREAWKEEQEKIRLGLAPPPEPKLRISNLMRVLGTEAVQDPTKMEAHVRAQMLKRQKAHEDANASRKLTDEQKREKAIRKLKEDTSLGVHVTVYRVNDLTSASKKFKVETNAKQLFMTGGVIMFHDCNIIVVEGGPKQQKKFKRLMLHRIKWEEDMVKTKDGKEVPNKCVLVWEGMTKQRNFGEMKFKACPTEKLAREQLKKHGVEHYWDLAYSKTILDITDDK